MEWAKAHSHSEALRHFGISSSQLYLFKKEFASGADPPGRLGVTMPNLVLARRLRKDILNRIKASDEIGDLELNALLLINELLR